MVVIITIFAVVGLLWVLKLISQHSETTGTVKANVKAYCAGRKEGKSPDSSAINALSARYSGYDGTTGKAALFLFMQSLKDLPPKNEGDVARLVAKAAFNAENTPKSLNNQLIVDSFIKKQEKFESILEQITAVLMEKQGINWRSPVSIEYESVKQEIDGNKNVIQNIIG